MYGSEWVQVPVGLEARRWLTRSVERTVLAVVHSVVCGQRLLDVLRLFEGDGRVQVVFTRGPEVFGHGVDSLLARLGAVTVPWQQATSTEFDLAVAASYGGIADLHAPVLVTSHGAGFNKRVPTVPGAALPARREVFGLGSQWLVSDGRVVPAAILLSHEEQLARLAESCPEAVEAAVVTGDVCYDRLLASLWRRKEYRRALGVDDEEQLIVVASTWGADSLYGQDPELLVRLQAEQAGLPDGYRLAVLLHPNVWYGHGVWQVRTWLAAAVRAGLSLVGPEEEWRAVLAAADGLVGDHGSATVYGAAIGLPVLLAGAPGDTVDPESAAGGLARIAPRLRCDHPLRPQFAALVGQGRQAVAGLVSSRPGEAAAATRAVMYRLLDLSEPVLAPSSPAVFPARPMPAPPQC
ncbi:MAG: hypothetical protein ACJ73S_12225 [Mycobacteriales bacterium]